VLANLPLNNPNFTYQHPPLVESSLHLLTLPHPKVCCDVPFGQSEIHFCHLVVSFRACVSSSKFSMNLNWCF